MQELEAVGGGPELDRMVAEMDAREKAEKAARLEAKWAADGAVEEKAP